jgi:ribonuclease HI
MLDEVFLFTDGASRGNPGPAAISYRIVGADGQVLAEWAECIGPATNNQAEYRALITGLRACAALTAGRIRCGMDSELVVKQLSGEYRTRDVELRRLRTELDVIASAFASVEYKHWPRSHPDIVRVDALANQALDVRTA